MRRPAPTHLNAYFSRAHVAAREAELLHARERVLTEVAVLDATRLQAYALVCVCGQYAFSIALTTSGIGMSR